MDKYLFTVILILAQTQQTLSYRNLGYAPASRANGYIRKQHSGLDCPHLENCPKRCDNDVYSTKKCPYGDSLVWDQCGCECRTCARQVGESCSGMHPCDDVKDLYCDETSKKCKNLPGRPCMISGIQYESGDQFKPNCNLNCTCLNGDIGCMPACKIDLDPTPPNCLAGFRAHKVKESECCDKWECIDENLQMAEREKKYHRGSIVAAAAIRPEAIELIRRKEDDCLVQTTTWGECSKSCGIGISERVSNDNPDCELKREVRLCNIRPCRDAYMPPPPTDKGKCSKPVRSSKTIRLSFSGCLSERSFRPKFCPNCGKGLCCQPKKSVTKSFNLNCKNDGETIRKQYLWITECECSKEFCNSSKDIFYGFHAMSSDTSA